MHGPTAHPAQQRLARAFSSVRLVGPPMGELLVRLVAHLFTPEEAEAALQLPWYRQQPLELIAARSGRAADDLRPVLDGLYERGVIYRGVTGYALLPLVPGMFEYLLMGCGNCVDVCPEGAIELVVSDGYRRPARDFRQLGLRLMPSIAFAMTRARIARWRR